MLIRIAAISIVSVLFIALAGLLIGCSKISDSLAGITLGTPTAENTFTSMGQVNAFIGESAKQGLTEINFNIAIIGEDDLKHAGDGMNTFYGKPESYVVNHEFMKLDDIIPGEQVNVKNITTTIKRSNNYYIVDYIKNGKDIPEKMDEAQQTAERLMQMASEVPHQPGASDYETALKAHDWIVENFEYARDIDEFSTQNGSFGALVNGRTMCKGYAETMALYLTCYTDTDNEMIVGDAKNAPDAEWVGHAWNLVNMDGGWYHVDATFDDPEGSTGSASTHFYFGQSDHVMSQDHTWLSASGTPCESGDFLYYRNSGKFVEGWDAFRGMMIAEMKNGDPSFLEVAAVGVAPDQKSMQFMYKANKNLENIIFSTLSCENTSVFSFELYYDQQ
ncbi:MAG: hypothetical protein LBK04_01080 [Clostridiales Family XIII bacterium]|nr:hypothetical protein [Clostridiales Family XIII bacterium]